MNTTNNEQTKSIGHLNSPKHHTRNTNHPEITTLQHEKQQKLLFTTPILKLQNC